MLVQPNSSRWFIESMGVGTLVFGCLLLWRLHLGFYPIVHDEIWAATAINGNPWDVVIFTLRFDIHPPLYYVFVDLWALASRDDVFLTASSMVTHAALVSLIFYQLRNQVGWERALIGAILVATTPLLLEYSLRLRMYSLFALLGFCSFLLLYRMPQWEIQNRQKRPTIIAYYVLALLLIYTHVTGIVFIFCCFLYGVMKYRHQGVRCLSQWVVSHLLLAVLSLPVFANSVLKSVSHAVQPSFDVIIDGSMVNFLSVDGISLPLTLGAITYLLIHPQTRTASFCFILAPIMIFSTISLVIKPIWLDRNFVAYIAISLFLLALILPLQLTSDKHKKFTTTLMLCFAAGIGFANIQSAWLVDDRSVEFAEAVNELDSLIEQHQATCVESSSQLIGFWKLTRYVHGVDWGHPLQVQMPLQDKWIELKSKVPAFVATLLALDPVPNFVERDGLTITSGSAAHCDDKTTLVVSSALEPRFTSDTQKHLFSNNDYRITLRNPLNPLNPSRKTGYE